MINAWVRRKHFIAGGVTLVQGMLRVVGACTVMKTRSNVVLTNY